jgi:hypothetical protein
MRFRQGGDGNRAAPGGARSRFPGSFRPGSERFGEQVSQGFINYSELPF